MKNNLVEHKFSDIYEMGSGISTKPEQAGHGFPFISFSTIFNNPVLPDEISDLMDTSEKERVIYSVKKGDVLLTRTSETIDELAMSSVAIKDYPNATFSGFAKRLRPIKEGVVYPQFMAYFLRSDYFRKIINCKSIMTLRASFNEEIFSYIKAMMPSYSEQIKIGDLCFLIEKKIRNNNKINAELESMAKTLYDYWFLQFEFPNEEGKPYKSSGGKMVWNEKLKREIPEGWEVENLMECSICDDIKAGVDYFEQKIYLPTANIDGDRITDGDFVTFDNRENRANMEPIKYSVWFAKMKNSIKHLTIPGNSNWFTNKYILSTGFQGLKCNPDSLPYIHCIINSDWFEKYKDVLSHGATQEGVNNEDLKNIKFAVPTNNVLKRFSNIVLPLLERKFSIIKENQELTSLRDFLLPLLMNGQVTFKGKSYEQ